MKLIYNNYFDILLNEYRQAKEVLIVSPYVTLDVVQKIISQECSGMERSLTFITLPPGEEYIDGSLDPRAIFELKQAGFSIYFLDHLHAKIYLFDRRILYLGSANMTSNGIGINEKGNREILARYRVKEKDADELLNNFLHDATEANLTHGWIEKIQDLLQQLGPVPRQDNYEDILYQIRTSLCNGDTESRQVLFLKKLHEEGIILSFEHIPSGYYKHAYLINGHPTKVFRSKQGSHDENTFSYQITHPTAKLIRHRKIKAILFILEEDPDRFVCLPSGFLIDNVLKKEFTNQADDWQLKIKRDKSLWISPHGKKLRIDISLYEGRFHDVRIRNSIANSMN